MDERKKAAVAHLLGLTGYLCPLLNVIVPLVYYYSLKGKSPFVDSHCISSINWQISLTIYGIVAGLLAWIMIGFIFLPILIGADIIFIIMAVVAANNDKEFIYPASIKIMGS